MLTVIFPPGPTHPLPIFCSEIVPKLTVTVTEKLCFALLFFGGRTPALRQACCVHGFPSTVLGVQVQGDTKDNLTFTAWAIQVACAPEYEEGGGCIWGHAGGCQVVWLLSLGPPSGTWRRSFVRLSRTPRVPLTEAAGLRDDCVVQTIPPSDSALSSEATSGPSHP